MNVNIPNELQYRVLLCFLTSAPDDCTVIGISRTLQEEKYKISRALMALEREGLVDRTNNRAPVLTESGAETAARISARVNVSLNHLLYEGVDMESAKRDAFLWALYCTDKTIAVMSAGDERYRVKYELRDAKRFSGAELCRRMKDGLFNVSFLIYREKMKEGNILSMANNGFEHPCALFVENGKGVIQLKSQLMKEHSGTTGKLLSGRVSTLRYFDSGRFVSAETNGTVFSFPADVLNFVSVGSGMGQVLHGTVKLQMECSVGIMHMPTSDAIFTVLI